jgi:RHS repeat-associated protein
MSIDGDRNTSYQRFDPDGRITATVNGRGYTSLQMYDANGNVTASVDGDGNTTQYAFDYDGNQTAVIDPDHNTTTMAFDADGHVTQTISPTSGTTLQYYDGDGNLTQSIAADGTIYSSSIVYTYDGDDRQTQQLWYDSGSSLVDTQNKTYDNNGNLLTASNSNGTYTFAYDHDGRLTNVQEPFSASLSYAYDGDGNQTQVVDSFGGTQTSVYDMQDRLVTREYTGESQEMRVDFTYGANGQVNTETRYDMLSGPAYMAGTDVVAVTDTGYDADGNVTSIQSVDSSSAVIDAFTYTYDRAGNLQNETDTQQSVATTTTYSYDDANQLLSAGTLSYSYDANGNRPNADASPVTSNQVSNDASWTYTYDANGNLSEKDTTTALSDEHWTYAYDNKNELTAVKHYNSSNTLVLTVDYKYDVFGNLIEEDATNGVGTTTTKFAVDGWNSNMASAVGLENFNDWAVLNADNSLQTRNLFGNNVDQALGRVDQTGATDSAGQYWDLTDHLGSVRDVVNSGGTVKDSVAYDAYGNVIGTDPHANYRGMYDWTGRQVDLETGLQYNRARWYDSTTGRWISQDPMGFDAGDSNLYRYVHNQSTAATDPSGYWTDVGQPAWFLTKWQRLYQWELDPNSVKMVLFPPVHSYGIYYQWYQDYKTYSYLQLQKQLTNAAQNSIKQMQQQIDNLQTQANGQRAQANAATQSAFQLTSESNFYAESSAYMAGMGTAYATAAGYSAMCSGLNPLTGVLIAMSASFYLISVGFAINSAQLAEQANQLNMLANTLNQQATAADNQAAAIQQQLQQFQINDANYQYQYVPSTPPGGVPNPNLEISGLTKSTTAMPQISTKFPSYTLVPPKQTLPTTFAVPPLQYPIAN